MRRFFLLAALPLLAACEEEVLGPEVVPCHTILTSYQPLSGDTVTTSEGIRYFDVTVGSGQAAGIGGTVDVNYTLYLLDGARQDTSCDGDPVIRFLLGGTQVLDGFQIGVLGMREGGVRRVVLPVGQGYPPNHPSGLGDDVLVFDIELVDQL